MPREPRRRRARIDARVCSTCSGPPASRSSRRSRRRSSSRRTTATCPASTSSRSPRTSRPSRTSWSPSTADRSPASRTSAAAATAARELIVIDHHISNECYGTINVVEPEAAASGWVVQQLIDELGLAARRATRRCVSTPRWSAIPVASSTRPRRPAVFDLARRLTEFDVPDRAPARAPCSRSTASRTSSCSARRSSTRSSSASSVSCGRP